MTTEWADARLEVETAEAHARHAKRLARIAAEKAEKPAKTSKADKAKERRQQALALRQSGLTYRQVGEKMGCGIARASQLCELARRDAWGGSFEEPVESLDGLEVPARELISRFFAARGQAVSPEDVTHEMLDDVYWPDVELFDRKATRRWADAAWRWMKDRGTSPMPFDEGRVPKI